MMRALRFLLLAVMFAIPLGLAFSQRPATDLVAHTLRARAPEDGGWSKDLIEVTVGEPVMFRLTSDDVMHGFAIAHSEFSSVDIVPGVWTEASWIPELPGEYTFYCTRWCGPNHWRMTGTILVTDPSGSFPTPTSMPEPRYLSYGLDLDGRQPLASAEGVRPSAARGADLSAQPSLPWMNPADPDLTTPIQAWSALRRDPELTQFDDLQLWDLLAHLWTSDAAGPDLVADMELYQANCAACHGAEGDGRGVMARYFVAPTPADFTNLARMANANNVILEGKILRGGMGTGMPYWGSILTPEEIGALLHYIWQFTFSGH